MMSNAMRCTSCNKQKAELKEKKSKLLPDVTMRLCQDCLTNKREPRGYIVLAGRERGLDYISYWIKGNRYIGEPITVRELT